MNSFKYNLIYAASVANYVHKNIAPAERLIPIFLDDVLKYRDDIVVKYADLHGLDGFTAYDEKNKKYLIVIDVSCEHERRRFTLAHELGHVFLQHFTKNKNLPDFIQEQAANAFAGELLMPFEMMKKTSGFPPDYIFSLFGVSYSAYACRLSFLKKYMPLGDPPDGFLTFKDIFKYTKNYAVLNGSYKFHGGDLCEKN